LLLYSKYALVCLFLLVWKGQTACAIISK
jgi:hypothetical protein